MTDEPKPPSALALSVPLTEAVLASFERLARGEPTEDLVKALVADVMPDPLNPVITTMSGGPLLLIFRLGIGSNHSFFT